MTLEDFKDVYKDKTPVEKLNLMQVQHSYWRNDMKDRIDANWKGNYDEARYYASECEAMRDRIVWLHEEISKTLENQEPVKPYMDFDGRDVWLCGNCHCKIFHPSRTDADVDEKNYRSFCFHCGRKVKWCD